MKIIACVGTVSEYLSGETTLVSLDVNECDDAFCGAGHGCEEIPFPYACHCNRGYAYNPNVYGSSCTSQSSFLSSTKLTNNISLM